MRLTKQEGRNRINEGLALVKRAIERFDFLKRHARVLVGVSGGIDSIVLLALLHEYNQRFDQKWLLHACHVNLNVVDHDLSSLTKFIKDIGIEFTVVKARLRKTAGSVKVSQCYSCSRLRRQQLLEVAESFNIFQIALAHHKQDVAETILLNMMYNGEISTLVPKQPVIQGRYFFTRPLYYFEKDRIETVASVYKLPVSVLSCPYFKNSKRAVVRQFLEQCKQSNPDVYKNIFRGIFHVKRAYLP